MQRAMHWSPLFLPAYVVAAPFQDALKPVGPQAAHIYDLWVLMFVVCTIVFIAILVGFAIALWRAPRATETTPPDVEAIRSPESRVVMVVATAIGLSAVGLLGLIIASVTTDRALAGLPLKDGVV